MLGGAAMPGAESRALHDREISAVAGPTGLRLEHVEVVTLMIAVLETLGAKRHASRDL